MKIRIGISVDKEVLKKFRENMRKHRLSLSAVVEALMVYFNEKVEGEL